MFKKGIALCLTIFVICIGKVADAQGKSSNRIVSERPVAQIDVSSWIPKSFRVSPDSKRVVCAAQVGNKQFVVVDGNEGKHYDGIMEGYPIFSLDSKRVAYVARVGNKWLVVVDGKEEKQYDGIGEGSQSLFHDPK